MDADYLALLIDLHKRQKRQGPGGKTETARALALAGLDPTIPLKIADIGCGTGASTLQLAESLTAEVIAVDFLPDFIDILQMRARQSAVADRIRPQIGTMTQLPFTEAQFDVIWSEGAIYNMGFENGVRDWRRFLKPGGVLVVSEITWISGTRPREVQDYWDAEYPEIAPASAKINILEDQGYQPAGYFVLPESCWLENYYLPLHDALPPFLKRHDNSALALSIAAAEKKELALYHRYKDFYSYGMYVARKPL